MFRTLGGLQKGWKACEKCGLCSTRRKIVFACGPPDADIMLIGEAPGEEEDKTGVPFNGPSGGMLEWVCDQAGVDPESLFMTNLLMCRPPDNRDPAKVEIQACQPRLLDAIRLVDPNLIIASGRVASQTLTKQRTLSVLKQRGTIIDSEFEGPFGAYTIPVLITVHPALLLRNPDMDGGILSATVEDFRMARKINQKLKNAWGTS